LYSAYRVLHTSNALSSLNCTARPQWLFYVGARGHRPPKSCPGPPKFLDSVVLLLVQLIGSVVISLKFRLAVVASKIMRGQQARIQRGLRGLKAPRKIKNVLQNASKCTMSKEKMPTPHPRGRRLRRLHSSAFGTRPPDHISAYGPGGQAPQIFFS